MKLYSRRQCGSTSSRSCSRSSLAPMPDTHGTPAVVVRVLGQICVVIAGLAGVTACYSPSEPVCGFICGPGGACPDHYSCNGNGQCQRAGTAATACDAV